jgi:hypothetical protein
MLYSLRLYSASFLEVEQLIQIGCVSTVNSATSVKCFILRFVSLSVTEFILRISPGSSKKVRGIDSSQCHLYNEDEFGVTDCNGSYRMLEIILRCTGNCIRGGKEMAFCFRRSVLTFSRFSTANIQVQYFSPQCHHMSIYTSWSPLLFVAEV